MKLAVVAGGWHWPAHFYREMAAQADGADLFVVSHRSPELEIVRTEKLEELSIAPGPLGNLDRELYSEYPSIAEIESMGWRYCDAPNVAGDLVFLNQWLGIYDYRKYEAVLFMHDDSLVRSGLLPEIVSRWGDTWSILSNGHYPTAPACYTRGSFEVIRRRLLDQLGGQIPTGTITLDRTGLESTPYGQGLDALAPWNSTNGPLREFMVQNKLTVSYLSNYYRVSPWLIEGERGFLSWMGGAPWSFNAGLKEFGVIE